MNVRSIILEILTILSSFSTLVCCALPAALVTIGAGAALASVVTKEVPWDKVHNYGVVVTDEDGRVKSFQEKPQKENALSNFASTGIYIFEPEVIERLLRDEIRPRQVEHLFEAADRLAGLDLTALTEAELEDEIQLARLARLVLARLARC